MEDLKVEGKEGLKEHVYFAKLSKTCFWKYVKDDKGNKIKKTNPNTGALVIEAGRPVYEEISVDFRNIVSSAKLGFLCTYKTTDADEIEALDALCKKVGNRFLTEKEYNRLYRKDMFFKKQAAETEAELVQSKEANQTQQQELVELRADMAKLQNKIDKKPENKKKKEKALA